MGLPTNWDLCGVIYTPPMISCLLNKDSSSSAGCLGGWESLPYVLFSRVSLTHGRCKVIISCGCWTTAVCGGRSRRMGRILGFWLAWASVFKSVRTGCAHPYLPLGVPLSTHWGSLSTLGGLGAGRGKLSPASGSHLLDPTSFLWLRGEGCGQHPEEFKQDVAHWLHLCGPPGTVASNEFLRRNWGIEAVQATWRVG